MTRTLLLLLSLLCFQNHAEAADGYKVSIRFTDTKDSMIYLCHYYGKTLPTVFRDDSARLSSNGEAVFTSKRSITGGMYLILFADNSAMMELILKNGNQFSITCSKKALYEDAVITGESENTDFFNYQKKLIGIGKTYKNSMAELGKSATAQDSLRIRESMKKNNESLLDYRKDFIRSKPGSFLSTIFKAIEEPVIPKELPLKADGSKDSSFPRAFYKQHYWNEINLKDDRLLYTPLYEKKLSDFFSRLVSPVPDSVNIECDNLLKQCNPSSELFRYTLSYLTHWAEASKIMGLDESFVYLIENYYMRGKAPWVDSPQMAKLIKRAGEIAPNLVGKPAMDLHLLDTSNKKTISLYDVNADYTVVLFWSPTCHHCQKEVPIFDSLYRNVLKKYNLKIYAVETDHEDIKWKAYIKEHQLKDGWIHVHDPNKTTDYRSFYDVYATPTVFLLDRKKIIRGKRLNVTDIPGLIEWLEKKKKD